MSDVATLTLADFLLARYAEAEQKARSWRLRPYDGHISTESMTGEDLVVVRLDHGPGQFMSNVEFRERFCDEVVDESIVADLAAKRRIVALHPLEAQGHPQWRYGGCSLCDGDESGVPYGAPYEPCDTLKALASPYADHPDYQQEWRP